MSFSFFTIKPQVLNIPFRNLKLTMTLQVDHKERNEFYLYSLAQRILERLHGLEHFLRGQNMG